MISEICEMKDPRYDTVKGLLEAGAIKKFSDIFEWIPKTTIRVDIATNGKRINKLTENPGGFQLIEIYQIAMLIGYDPKKLLTMAAEELDSLEKNSTKAKK